MKLNYSLVNLYYFEVIKILEIISKNVIIAEVDFQIIVGQKGNVNLIIQVETFIGAHLVEPKLSAQVLKDVYGAKKIFIEVRATINFDDDPYGGIYSDYKKRIYEDFLSYLVFS